MFDIPCVIFAGGKSSRMGEDKALLPFASYTTLTEYQYSRLSKIFKNVYISCKDAHKFDFDANFIEDNKSSELFAPTAGFLAAFRNIKGDAFFALSVDAPFVDAKVITQLVHADKETFDATIAKTPQGLQPLCGIYHRSLEKEFEKMLKDNNHKLGFLLKNSNTNIITFDDTSPFLNMNHPDEYKKALQILETY